VGSLPRGERGERGPAGPAGPTGPAGSARAYGYVSETGTLDAARSKGGATVSHTGGTGVYCITIPGISSASSVMSVNLDLAGSETTLTGAAGDSVGFAEVSLTPEPPCTAGQFDVTTFAQTFSDPGGINEGNDLADQPFMFIVP
jgi:hypothetical protein